MKRRNQGNNEEHMAGDLRYIFNMKFILVQGSAGEWFVFKCQKQFFVNTSQWQLNEPSSISPTLNIISFQPSQTLLEKS